MAFAQPKARRSSSNQREREREREREAERRRDGSHFQSRLDGSTLSSSSANQTDWSVVFPGRSATLERQSHRLASNQERNTNTTRSASPNDPFHESDFSASPSADSIAFTLPPLHDGTGRFSRDHQSLSSTRSNLTSSLESRSLRERRGSNQSQSNPSDQDRLSATTSSSSRRNHELLGEISDYSGSVSAAELSDMIGLTEEEEDDDDDDGEDEDEEDADDVIDGDQGYLSTSEKDHDGDVEEDQEDQDNIERIVRRKRIRKNSKLGINTLGRRSASGGESLTSFQSAASSSLFKDQSDVEDPNHNGSDQHSKLDSSLGGVNSWSWFSRSKKGKGKALNDSSSFLQVSDANRQSTASQEENSVIYTSGSSDGEDKEKQIEQDFKFEESLASNPQAQSAGLGSRSTSTRSSRLDQDRFVGKSESDLGSSLGQAQSRVPKRRHRRHVLDGEFRSSKRSNTSQSGMSKDGRGRLDIGLIHDEKERLEDLGNKKSGKLNRIKDAEKNATSRKAAQSRDRHQAVPNGETISLSTRKRLIGSLLQKLFDLEPEVLDSFLQGGVSGGNHHQSFENVNDAGRNERLSLGLPGDLDSNSRYEYDYQDSRSLIQVKNRTGSRLRSSVDGREVDDEESTVSSGEETAMEENLRPHHQGELSSTNHLSPILQLSRPQSRRRVQFGDLDQDRSRNSGFEKQFCNPNSLFKPYEEGLSNEQEVSESIQFSKTVKQLQLQSRQLSHPDFSASNGNSNNQDRTINNYAFDSTSSTAFEPSALEALNDVLSNVPFRFLGQLAKRIGFGWSIWSASTSGNVRHQTAEGDLSPRFEGVDGNHLDLSWKQASRSRRSIQTSSSASA